MPEKKIVDLQQVGKDTPCENKECHNIVVFGTFAFVNQLTGAVLCLDCGAERGYSSKAHVMLMLAERQHRKNITLLKVEENVRLDAIALLDKQIDLTRLAERDAEIENRIVAFMALVSKFLTESIGTSREKAELEAAMKVVEDLRELELELRDHIRNGLYNFENKPKRKKRVEVPA